MLNLTSLALALAAQGAVVAAPSNAQDAGQIADAATELAVDLIMTGQKQAALIRLEQQRDMEPNDPAVLINLGIAYAQMGYEEKARASFKIALASPQTQELDTADGRTMDSRRLARHALQMLDRGEFAPS
jgi:Tfp pilus assembly protein PilF